jgi:hypothetical protein
MLNTSGCTHEFKVAESVKKQTLKPKLDSLKAQTTISALLPSEKQQSLD